MRRTVSADLLDIRILVHPFRHLTHEIVNRLLVFGRLASCIKRLLISFESRQKSRVAYLHGELCYPDWFTETSVLVNLILDSLKIGGVDMYSDYIWLDSDGIVEVLPR